MTNISNQPLVDKNGNVYFKRHSLITGDSIDEIIDIALPRIRTISQPFYKKEIAKDLVETGVSGIDIHAGMGTMYTIKLNS